jgi:protein SCO1/2
VRARVRFVLVSFDSEHDTPAVLRAYRRQDGIPGDTWTLAWGKPDDVRELAMVLGVKYQRFGDGQFGHSNLITVLNGQGEIAYQRVGLQGDDGAVIHAVSLAAD